MDTRVYITVLTTMLGLNLTPSALLGEERYYMLIFASQTTPNLPRTSHTYGAFVRVLDGGENASHPAIESWCISWLPSSLSIEPLRRAPVQGVNLNLDDTNQWARSIGASVTMWGPYRITRELYLMAERQKKRLSDNAIAYICLDRMQRDYGACNCIHALSDLDTTQPPLITGTARGEQASLMVLDHFRRYVVAADEDTSWLCQRLNLSPAEINFATQTVRSNGSQIGSSPPSSKWLIARPDPQVEESLPWRPRQTPWQNQEAQVR